MKRYEYGTAHTAESDGYTKLRVIEIAEVQHVMDKYADQDVAVVDGSVTRYGRGQFVIYVRSLAPAETIPEE